MTNEELGRMLYPDAAADPEWFDSPYDYQPIIDWIGSEIASISAGNYQGDTFAVVTRDGRYAFLCISWGSCSGCDALRGCRNYAAIGLLAHQIANEARWFDSLDACRAWVNDDARKLEHEYYTDEWAAFVAAVNNAKGE